MEVFGGVKWYSLWWIILYFAVLEVTGKSFCEARNLVKGHAIKLGATENTRSVILHIRHVS